jgi:hypothetical protein
MTTTISVVAADNTYEVQSDGATVTDGLRSLEEALELTALLIRCNTGDQFACAELDARGIEPPMLEPDSDDCPVCRNELVVHGSAAFSALVDCPACSGH